MLQVKSQVKSRILTTCNFYVKMGKLKISKILQNSKNLVFFGGGCRPWNLFLRWIWPQKSGLIWISSKKTKNCSKWVEFRAENVKIMTVFTFFEAMIKRTNIHSILKNELSASEEIFFSQIWDWDFPKFARSSTRRIRTPQNLVFTIF